jgi:hypothetical protein
MEDQRVDLLGEYKIKRKINAVGAIINYESHSGTIFEKERNN